MAPSVNISDYATDTEDEDSSPPSTPLSPTEDDIPRRVGNFVLLAEHQLDVPPYIRVAKWQSEKSGLKVVWADVPSPISRFWTTVVTEVFDSSGVPHSKEHLTFTASKHYPYSGILDAITNRMLSEGANADTDLDNTTYTFESASEEGILAVTPVYLDHILFPLFTPEIFKTEIYHVDGHGEEGGVVFSEMQGRQGSEDDVLQLAGQQALYDFRNGYRYETGGMLPHLRKLTLEKIEAYHKTAYCPQNITVFIAGHAVRPGKLLATIQATVEKNLTAAGLAKGPRPPGWVRPFVESSTARNPPMLDQDYHEKVEYADTDTSTGMINISWIGPPCPDWLTAAALGALAEYLAGSSTSPLSQKFVEIPNPACSAIAFGQEFRDPMLLTVLLVSVPSTQLDTLAGEFFDALEEICRRPFDMKRMAVALKQQKLQLHQLMETSPATYCQASVLQDIIYGREDGSQLKDVFNDLEMIKKLETFTADDWLDLLDTWFVERHSVTLVGVPSPSLAEKQSADEAARVEANRKKYGPSGLAKLGADLAAAEKANNYPPPASLVERFKIPDINKIAWIEVETARSNGVGRGKETFSGRVQRHINRDGPDLPFFVQFDHFESSFIDVSIFLHGPPLPIIALYLDTFFCMPIHRFDGTRLTWQQASRQLDEDALGFSAQTLEEGILVTITVVKEDYIKAITWLSDSIFGVEFDVERLQSLVNSTLQNLPSEKEDASGVASAAVNDLTYSLGSLQSPINLINQAKFYPELRTRLAKDANGVVADLEDMRKKLVDPRGMRVSVAGDILSLDKPSSSWLEHFEQVPSFRLDQLAHMLRPRDLLTPLGHKPAKKAVIYTIPSSESTYLFARSRSPDWTHKDHPALSVAATCLSATNGFFWNVIRSGGLAYGAMLQDNVEAGCITFVVYKSPDAFAALVAARKLIQSIVEGKVMITQNSIDAAKSQQAYEKISALSTYKSAASASFVDTVIMNRPPRMAQLLLSKIKDVTIDDVTRVIKTWIAPLFDAQTSIIGASTTEGKREELASNLEKLGYDVEQRRF
ncbi:hypothetical protein JCM1840_004199 [Sporobolomyces johnsonii]